MTDFNRYLPHTAEDIAAMLERCGTRTLDDLYADVPRELRLKKPYGIGKPMSEPELESLFRQIGALNKPMTCFAGAGFYHHYTPAAVGAICSRSEFATAYTPYQPEISQGTLQYIFEYQSMMAELTGMDASNASVYDGATATAEAMIMSVASARKRNRVLISSTLSPAVAQVLSTYAVPRGIILEVIPAHHGVTDRAELRAMLGAGDVAGVILQQPNYFGIIEDWENIADDIHAAKALMVVNAHASTLGVLRSPGEWGADIACGEAQSLGMPLNYGGPYLGYLCCRKALLRKLPGRIVGATTDARGNRAFVLTLQAREQHIRRQKATSNICSNQGIMTLHAAVYLSLMGEAGLRKVNELSCCAAHALAKALAGTGRLALRYPEHPFLNEFVMDTVDPLTPQAIIDAAAAEGILAGVPVGENGLMLAATEMCTPHDIERLTNIVSNL